MDRYEVHFLNEVEEARYGQGLAAVSLALVDAGKAIRALLDLVGTGGRACRYCGAALVMVKHAGDGKGWAPYDYPAGTNHFLTCPQAAQVRADVAARKRARAQAPRELGGLTQALPSGLVQSPPAPPEPGEDPAPRVMAAGAGVGVQGTMFEAAADPRRWMRS